MSAIEASHLVAETKLITTEDVLVQLLSLRPHCSRRYSRISYCNAQSRSEAFTPLSHSCSIRCPISANSACSFT